MNFVGLDHKGLFDESEDAFGLSVIILVLLGLVSPLISNRMAGVTSSENYVYCLCKGSVRVFE